MGEAIDRLIALAGTQRVKGYTRTSSLGNVVHVSSYTRSVASMTNGEIMDEMKEIGPVTRNPESGLSKPQWENRLQQLRNEQRKRVRAGRWFKNGPEGQAPDREGGGPKSDEQSTRTRLRNMIGGDRARQRELLRKAEQNRAIDSRYDVHDRSSADADRAMTPKPINWDEMSSSEKDLWEERQERARQRREARKNR